MAVSKIIKLVFIAIIFAALGVAIGVFVRKRIEEKNIGMAKSKAASIIEESEKQAETLKKEILLEAKEEVHKLRSELDLETKERRLEIQSQEKRLLTKEENLDKKTESVEKKDEFLEKRMKEIDTKEKEIEKILEEQKEELNKISGLTKEEAKEILLSEVKSDITHDTANLIREMVNKAKEESEKKAREVISYAIQRCAADHVAETTVSVVNLPSDDMKGRIIGREGRNIRTLETLTGIDLIIDDTPEAVILSGFDPMRREIARIALEKLIVDGRIHPARIEEMVERAKKEISNHMREQGEQAAFDAGVHGLHPEIVKLLGRLTYRTSYGQNILKHSVEVSKISGYLAEELGANVKIATRGGLLHDLGKSMDREMEGPHVKIGVDLARKYKESKEVIHAIEAHHGDVEPETIEAIIVQAADAISAARPGARRETFESYIKRLQRLEEIANSFEGIEKSYAIQAGREIRIMVQPEIVNDDEAVIMAREIVKKIESELAYPGQIKVNIIRETRAVDYAK